MFSLLIGEFSWVSCRQVLREIGWEFCRIFIRTHKNMKVLKVSELFRKKIRISKEIVRANFILQTRRPKVMCAFRCPIHSPTTNAAPGHVRQWSWPR